MKLFPFPSSAVTNIVPPTAGKIAPLVDENAVVPTIAVKLPVLAAGETSSLSPPQALSKSAKDDEKRSDFTK
ncbi:MAG: hypothetical protein U5M51_08685 [Emticicia sp.]|nr:hypothetical protein [Emticicia sp.]